ncbi:WD repeat-containing protein 49-like [Leucoraja erinacea]|uniref:WD repeat-containing protein 49-like n=1 Tax=Leucoraja erinaceus TaxID=7782 RepID=UPI002455E64E|nr:WD repeat-containing protein 49-like [Leucoraja erinacea]
MSSHSLEESEKSANVRGFRTLDSSPSEMGMSKKTLEKLENQLTVEDIMRLQDVLMPPGLKAFVPVNRKAFIDRLVTALGCGAEEEYGDLFDRIDVTRDGFVDWDKVTTFMLLGHYEKEERVKTSVVPQWGDIVYLPSHHKEPIQSIVHLTNSHRYLSISKDGWMSVWGENLKLQKTLRVATDSVRLRDLWVTSMIFMANVNKIAVAFTSKEICFYDPNSKEEFSWQYKLHGLCHILICMHYWYNPEDGNEAILTFGDVSGEVNAICFTSALISLFERPVTSTEEQETTVAISWLELLRGTHKCCFTLNHKGHSKEWVRQVSYFSNLEAFISCATTDINTIVLGWKEKGTTTLKVTAFHVTEGVNAFDYHPGLNLIASAAADHHIYLWNPYLKSRPTGILRGHQASVLTVQFSISRKQLFSFSKDKILRIWDMHHQLCVQRLAGIFPKPLEFQTILYFNELLGHLFTTFNSQLTLLEMKQEVGNCLTSHEKPVTCVLYNSHFKQVISSDVGSTVIIWMIETGQKLKQFTRCHGNSEITTMALNDTETRLFTASVDGTVKIWDFNGHCHHKLNAGMDQAAEISQILILKRSILILGWESKITVFRMDTLTELLVQPSKWKGKAQHHNDILCAAFLPPQTLATGSYDGEIVIWNNNSENASSRFHPCLNQTLQLRSGKLSAYYIIFLVSCRSITSRTELGHQVHFSIQSWLIYLSLLNLIFLPSPHSDQQQDSQTQGNVSTGSSGSPLFSADDEDNKYSYVITRMFFLENRRNTLTTGGANLVTCGASGVVRFWNSFKCQLLSEFDAHADALSIVMAVDKKNSFLITGDVNGCIKIWNIEDYCLNYSDVVMTQLPPMVAAIQPHSDCVNHLETCTQDGQLLILSAAADCSLVLSYISGSIIGVFGQDEHWRIGKCSPPPVIKLPPKEEKTPNQKPKRSKVCPSVTIDDASLMEEDIDSNSRVDIWQTTVLGKTFRESRIQRRPRPQLCTWEKVQSPIGTFSSLHMEDLEKIIDLTKPDFLQNPHKYFDGKTEEDYNEKQIFPTAPETLKVAFDEKSLFPKELLDREKKINLLHKEDLNVIKAKANGDGPRLKARQLQEIAPENKLGKR